MELGVYIIWKETPWTLAFHANSALRLTPRKFEFSLVNKEFDNLIAEHENKTCVVPSNREAVIHEKNL